MAIQLNKQTAQGSEANYFIINNISIDVRNQTLTVTYSLYKDANAFNSNRTPFQANNISQRSISFSDLSPLQFIGDIDTWLVANNEYFAGGVVV